MEDNTTTTQTTDPMANISVDEVLAKLLVAIDENSEIVPEQKEVAKTMVKTLHRYGHFNNMGTVVTQQQFNRIEDEVKSKYEVLSGVVERLRSSANFDSEKLRFIIESISNMSLSEVAQLPAKLQVTN